MAMTIVVQEADRGIRIDDLGSIYTVNRKNTKMFLSYLKRNAAESNKIKRVLSWTNSPYSD